jgi:excisionase family DNA binding protein
MAPGDLAVPSWTNSPAENGQDRDTADDRDLHELLTVDEVAALLKVSKSWVYEHTRSRGIPRSERLPHLKLGKYVRFDAEAVRAFLNRRCKVM